MCTISKDKIKDEPLAFIKALAGRLRPLSTGYQTRYIQLKKMMMTTTARTTKAA